MADKVFSLPLAVLVTEVVSALINEDVILLPVTSEVNCVEIEVTSIDEDATVTSIKVVAVLATTDVGDSMLVLV